MNKITVDLTEEEAEVIDNYIFRKASRLEEANLTDSYCYPKLMAVHHKLQKKINLQKTKKGL